MELTAHEIAQKIKAGLRQHRALLRLASLKPESLRVLEDQIYEENGCWYVTLEPDQYPEMTSPYFEALAEIETDLLFDEDINVFIVPTAPERECPKKPRARVRR